MKQHEKLQALFSAHPNVSLRKLASATNVSYPVLLKKSKEPVIGQPYDPEVTNWEAIVKVLERKNVDFLELNWEELNENSKRKGATLQKDVSAFPIGAKVYLRRNNETPYEIVYKTETHIVIQLEGTQEPIAWANNTFIVNGPVFEPRVTTKVEKGEEG